MQTDELADHLFAIRPRRARHPHRPHRATSSGSTSCCTGRAADRGRGRGALRDASALRPRVARAAGRRGPPRRRRRRRAADERRYSLPDEHRRGARRPDSLAYFAPFARLVAAAAPSCRRCSTPTAPAAGSRWDELRRRRCATGQADANRPLFLGTARRASGCRRCPRCTPRCAAGGRVADVGCGEGWSSIAIALAYPDARVDGFDVDAASRRRGAAARRRRRRRRPGRVPPRRRRGAAADDGGYDLVTAFECVHDMPDPVSVLAASAAAGARRAARCW